MFRVGPIESLLIRRDSADTVILYPIFPAKLYLTPDLPQYPGTFVKMLKLTKKPDGSYQTVFLQEKDAEGQWRDWNPNKGKL